jgi:hypothetical protein
MEIFRDVEFFDLVGDIDDLDVEDSAAIVARAFIDSGSTRTVVSRRVAESLRSVGLLGSASSGRRSFPMRLMDLRVAARGCELRALPVVVSDEVIAEADLDGADVILGHDALQRSRATLGFAEEATEHFVRCRPATGTRRSGR